MNNEIPTFVHVFRILDKNTTTRDVVTYPPELFLFLNHPVIPPHWKCDDDHGWKYLCRHLCPIVVDQVANQATVHIGCNRADTGVIGAYRDNLGAALPFLNHSAFDLFAANFF